MKGSFSPHPHQDLCTVLLITILTGVSLYFTVVSIFISLMITDVEHLFMCLLHICMFSLDKMSIQVLRQFFNQIFLILSHEFLIYSRYYYL